MLCLKAVLQLAALKGAVAGASVEPASTNLRGGPTNVGHCDCSWIWRDNCTDMDECALECRAAHPDGPCHNPHGDMPAQCVMSGDFVFYHKDGHNASWHFFQHGAHAWISQSGDRTVNGTLSYIGGSARLTWTWMDEFFWCSGTCPEGPFYCHEGSIIVPSYKAVNATSNTINDAAGNCDCSWLWRDDCTAMDDCAQACRVANPNGPCGGANGNMSARCPLDGAFAFNDKEGRNSTWLFHQTGPHEWSAKSNFTTLNGTINYMGNNAKVSWAWKGKSLKCQGSCPDGPFYCQEGSSFQRCGMI